MKKIILSLIFLSCAVAAYADTRTITVKECIDIALQNHPDYFISIEDQKKSISDYGVARSQKSLIINGEIRTVENEKDTETTSSGVEIPGKDTYIGLFAGITLYYNIYDAKKDYEEDMAKTNIDMFKIKSQKTKLDIIYNVKIAYYSYSMARNALTIREEIYRKNEKKALLAKQLFEGGSRPILDVSKAEVDLADARLQYEMAKNNERKMRMNLFHAMGLEDTEDLDIIPQDVEAMPGITVTLDELYNMSQIYSPLIRISVLEKRLAKMKISTETAAHYPRIDFQAGAGYELDRIRGADNYEKNFSGKNWAPAFYGLFFMTIPVYSGGRISARVDSAESDYNKINYREREILVETKNQIRDSYRSLEEIRKQLEISELIIRNAERHLLLAQKSYDNGGGSLLELQDAELSVIRARMGYLEARYNYLMTLARLSNIIGIGEESICGDSGKNKSE
ncbi:MAG TPA: TolC family protein [Spirochaetota bacterium]|nr:TolC family protein [Spirochaetota bacterium]